MFKQALLDASLKVVKACGNPSYAILDDEPEVTHPFSAESFPLKPLVTSSTLGLWLDIIKDLDVQTFNLPEMKVIIEEGRLGDLPVPWKYEGGLGHPCTVNYALVTQVDGKVTLLRLFKITSNAKIGGRAIRKHCYGDAMSVDWIVFTQVPRASQSCEGG